ncbi:MAG TPA: DUF4012 domain-containing protein, partial [Rugosimonospora sp.]|nr:DUF4012 domain-containing protein [Rugosimonospora sp.]
NLAPLAQAAPQLAAANRAVQLARGRIDALPVDGLDPRLRPKLVELRTRLGEVAAITGTLARAAALLPPMLGTDGPRTYLVLFQNLAEARATGGLPGAYLVVSADHGVIRIIDQGTALTGLGGFPAPVLPLDPAVRSLYTDRVGNYAGDVNFTPYFPTAAQLIREMYRRRSGRTVDGVLATDPVALSYLLRATGPIAVPGSAPLTSDTAVRTLLSQSYARWPTGPEQDRYFAAAARTVFAALLHLNADPRAIVDQLGRAGGERRLLLWSAHADEQRQISGTVLEGALPSDDGGRPTVGVFLNDGTGGKLGYYLTPAASLAFGACRPDGRRELRLRITLGSRAPRSGLPETVLGLALAGPYVLRTNVLVFAPTGGTVVSARLDGVPTAVGTGVEHGRNVLVLPVDLPPGGTHTIDASLLSADTRTGPAVVAPQLWTTPTVTPWHTTVASASRCD